MLIPPLFLVTDSVKGIVMDGAKRHNKLITHLARERSWLRKANMVGMRRLAATDQTGLPGHKFEMLF